MAAYEHSFVKLAEDSGFTFNIHKPRIRIDWNKIRSIDIDRLIRERRFVTIEQHVNDILNCLLESEFDCRILDEGVVKLFRLAQLTVEYQQFCQKHLHNNVMLLREELVSVTQDIDRYKKNIRCKEDEIKKLRKKVKQYHRPTVPTFGNENIAAMILKTLSNNDNIATPDLGDGIQHYNKCKYCDKVFLNQLYLKGHMFRRHQTLIDQDNVIAENNKVTANQQENKIEEEKIYLAENTKLNKEINELKNKLQDVNEKLEVTYKKLAEIDNESRKEVSNPVEIAINTDSNIQQSNENEESILKKIEEWKSEEQEKYKLEINILKEQIIDNINAFKIKNNDDTNMDIVQELRNTVKNQNIEITSLKQELRAMIQNIEKIYKERQLEYDERALIYNKLSEYNTHPRVLEIEADQENETLGVSPKKNLSNGTNNTYAHNGKETTKYSNSPQKKQYSIIEPNSTLGTTQKITDRQKSLEELHRKTQELLNIESSTDSSSSMDKVIPQNENIKSKIKQNYRIKKKLKVGTATNYKQNKDLAKTHSKINSNGLPNTKNKKKVIEKNTISKRYDAVDSHSDDNLPQIISSSSSPAKVVRAKLTEEVHKRLVEVGVDPLKTGVNHSLFEKQRTQLRYEEETKKKKNPAYDKVKHKILAFLDSKAAETLETTHTEVETTIEDKRTKNFRLASVLSNVKNKALSLIKSNDKKHTLQRKSRSEDLIQKANHIFKTPPSSVPDSPINQRRPSKASIDSNISSSPIKKISKPARKTIVVEVNKNKSKSDSDTDGIDSIDEIYNEKKKTIQRSKSVENIINSPLKKQKKTIEKYSYNTESMNDDSKLYRTKSTSGLLDLHSEEVTKTETINFTNKNQDYDYLSPDKVSNTNIKKYLSDDNVFIRNTQNVTKGVLKNAPSTSSLSKKKVIFDLDANQTKSVSASPSQSNTEKSDPNVEDAIETLNLEEEWDISSIESAPVNASRDNVTSSKATPKIAELTLRIESQLALRRDNKPPVGSVDVLRGLSRGGSNTSLGSSLLDDTDEPRLVSSKSIPLDKDASDIDLSEFSLDGISKHYKIK